MRVILFFFLSFANLFALSSQEIAKKTDLAVNGFGSSKSKVQMILINSNKEKSHRLLEFKNKELQNGDKSLISFLTPLDIKGTKLLTHEKINASDKQWIYLPSIKRIKKIVGKNKSGRFVGSEFSYEDFSSFDYRKYTYDSKVRTYEYDNNLSYEFIAIPTSKDSGYTKQKVTVDKNSFIIKKVEYFDKKDSLLKIAYFKKYEKISNVNRVREILMQNVQTNKQTILRWQEDEIKLSLPKSTFKKQYLKR